MKKNCKGEVANFLPLILQNTLKYKMLLKINPPKEIFATFLVNCVVDWLCSGKNRELVSFRDFEKTN